jgi:hypothetical protein
MSAFLCSDSHITALAVYASKRASQLQCNLDPKVVGKMLYDENVKSIDYRYDKRKHPAFKLCPWAKIKPFSPIEIIKAAHCLRYQSCEHPGYENSEAAKLVDAIADYAVQELDGWDIAAWEINKPD